jgi:hypothetical protein
MRHGTFKSFLNIEYYTCSVCSFFSFFHGYEYELTVFNLDETSFVKFNFKIFKIFKSNFRFEKRND